VFWTRGRREPDLTPAIRDTFTQVGFDEVGFDVGPSEEIQPGDTTWSVGTARFVGETAPFQPGLRLFAFTR
jgi:hypothetical protein